MEKVDLLIDQLGKGDNIFEQFAKEFTIQQLKPEAIPDNYTNLQSKLEIVERRLQDISEKINAQNEYLENKYEYTISTTKSILSLWFPIFLTSRLEMEQLNQTFDFELDKLIDYLKLENIENKSLDQIKEDFKSDFIFSREEILTIRDYLKVQDLESELSVNFVATYLANSLLHLENFEDKDNEQTSSSTDRIHNASIKVWIDTDDAGEANRFMSIVAGVFSSLEDVEVKIKDSGQGSFWQKWVIKWNGWFAKEETKQVLKKTQKALESYTLDKHIEPIEKSKADRQLIDAQIERMAPVDLSRQTHEIQFKQEQEKLRSLKLNNAIMKLDLISKASAVFASGLVTVDSDYRIEIDGILLIKQEAGKVEFINIEYLDNDLPKELPAPEEPKEDNKDNSDPGE